jgi:hypothetical protein
MGLEHLAATANYIRDGKKLQAEGLYLDVPPWQCHVFQMSRLA